MYQRYFGLEKYLLFGQCKMVFERCILLDVVKKKYYVFLVEGLCEVVLVVFEQVDFLVSINILFEGWVLKIIKKFY